MAASTSSVQNASPTQFVKIVEQSDVTQQFALNHQKFAHLANPQEFEQLKSHLIEIDIKSEMGKLTHDGLLEVTVPVLGLTDFMAASHTWHEFAQQFPVPLAINQFGAPSEHAEGHFYPQADFIVVKDILGNQFELFVNADGLIDIPEKGTGLFSVITEITYMFSGDQVLEGRGLSSLDAVGAEPGKLYLLPPPGSHERFNVNIAAAHLDEANHKIVDQALKISVVQMNDDLQAPANVNVSVNNLSDEHSNLLQIDVQFNKKNYNGESFALDIALERVPGVSYHPLEANTPWSITQADDATFTKQIGLSDYALTALVRNVFSEYDFSKALLSGESFHVSQSDGFNDFLLSPEAVGLYYDLFVSGLVKQTLPGEWLFEHVPAERIENLNLDYAFLDPHDTSALGLIINDVKAGHYDSFTQHFYNPDMPRETLGHETLYVVADNAESGFVPHVDASIHAIGGESLSGLLDMSSSLAPNIFHTIEGTSFHEITLSPGHEATKIHYADIVDIKDTHPLGTLITGFDLNHDKINLADLIENHAELSKDSVRTDIAGQDVHVVMTNVSTGQDLTVATLVGAHQNPNDVPPPPTHFIEFDT